MTTRKETLKAGKTMRVIGASHADRDRNQKRSLRGLTAFTNTFCKVVDTTASAVAKVRAVTPSTPESVQLAIVDLSSKVVDMQHQSVTKANAWAASVLETQTAKECASRITIALTDAIVKSIKEGADNKKLIKANADMDKIIKNQDEEIKQLKEVLAKENIVIGVFSEEAEEADDDDADIIEATFEDGDSSSAYKKYLKNINK